MPEGPHLASLAALIGDPARANMLTALMDGRALTVSELALVAGVGLPTASGHLARLDQAELLRAEKQGRHRYYRLSGAEVAEVLEGLMGLAQRTGAVRVRTGPKDAALREARICYDHLAGARAVSLMQSLVDRKLLNQAQDVQLSAAGRRLFATIGIDVEPLARGRRPVCRPCLDWSERKSHLGGALGAAILDHIVAARWARRSEGRVVTFSASGSAAFDRAFGLKQ